MKKAYLYSRVSTVTQSEQGEGITRQIDNAKTFLKNYPEYIIANDVFTDAASGFSGANLEENAGLGSFIKAAERGDIPKGSLLVIESPDRLSRLGIKKGQRIFDRIMECGIDIALVRFGIILKHDDENDSTGSLIVAVGLYLGNLESQQKSERINFSLQKKKVVAAGGEKYSGRSPAWLKLSKDRMNFELVPDNVEAVRLMFNLRATGSSFGQIEAELNKRKIKPFTSKALRWYEASISKILHYRQVLGEQQFYKIDKDADMILTTLAAVATMQREQLLEKQQIGIATAKAEGKYKGRVRSQKTIDKCIKALEYIDKDLSKEAAEKAACVGVATLYRYINEQAAAVVVN
ncbi:hypothetical protein CXF85_21560 [Colwellia sp. 75C3]|uniref:recombinase family protein n=1 Tax=Colwellia sp. 75C3 TaxID=888425 RepID=UPI000C334A0B|nr:recombinase family protein [Colwellia sp. 75C3]PKG80708.1 hypothetical protein CXF85_21560 [Colwellia sp. 75C3]